MRVLFVNKFWFRSGGVETVLFDEIEWLEAAGHQTAGFAVIDPRNEPSPWSDFFVPYQSLEAPGDMSMRDRILTAAAMFENPTARQRFTDLLRAFRPDIVHAHSVHRQLSPSIFAAARRYGVPVVQTLHDYHAVCPGDRLLQGDGTLCDPRECGRFNYLPAVRHRCMRGSAPQSAVAAAEVLYHRLRRSYESSVRRLIAPSDFLATCVRQGGWSLPVDVVRNAVRSSEQGATLDGQHVVLAGRLVPEKGLETAAEAASLGPFDLKVVGRGPMEARLASRPQVELIGWLDPVSMRRLYRGARAAIVPSEWFENAPLAVLEPMSQGVPVVASRIGGIPELVEEGVSGFLTRPGSAEEIAKAVRHLLRRPDAAQKMGGEALMRCRTMYSPEVHLESLLGVYQRALSWSRGTNRVAAQ